VIGGLFWAGKLVDKLDGALVRDWDTDISELVEGVVGGEVSNIVG
jgi:hypothetical protein